MSSESSTPILKTGNTSAHHLAKPLILASDWTRSGSKGLKFWTFINWLWSSKKYYRPPLATTMWKLLRKGHEMRKIQTLEVKGPCWRMGGHIKTRFRNNESMFGDGCAKIVCVLDQFAIIGHRSIVSEVKFSFFVMLQLLHPWFYNHSKCFF
jgi:hypothetical protein